MTVAYATSDGTAVAPADYEATSGTLTFDAGETTKTVSVPVHGDALDEGDETLTLTLSNPTGAYLADATATGTITNDGPIPQAWLARFGRTVADQVLDAVDARLRGARTPGIEAAVAGQALSFDSSPGDADAVAEREEEARVAGARGVAARRGRRGGPGGAVADAHGDGARAVHGNLVLADRRERGGRDGLGLGPGHGLALRRARGRAQPSTARWAT